jgi:peptide/nickel transport system permease protein
MSRAKALQYYVLTRLLLAPLMLWTIVTLVFILLRATPGDPADAALGSRASDAAKEEYRQRYGFPNPNQPWYEKLWLYGLQYIRYLGDLLHLDLGTSYSSQGQNVWEIIQQHFSATAELAIFGLTVAFLVGVGVGILSASRSGTILDAGGRLFGIITYSLPIFWVGMVLQLIFAVQLGWFPIGTRFPISSPAPEGFTGLYTIDSLSIGNLSQFITAVYYLALPSITLGVLLSGIFERIVRVNLKQTLKADYVEAARARGIPERRIVFAHALKNAMIPVITVLGLMLASLLGGAVLTEVTFSWPGLGYRLYAAISERDYTTVQGIMVFFGSIVVVASIAIDIINALIDPRIRY